MAVVVLAQSRRSNYYGRSWRGTEDLSREPSPPARGTLLPASPKRERGRAESETETSRAYRLGQSDRSSRPSGCLMVWMERVSTGAWPPMRECLSAPPRERAPGARSPCPAAAAPEETLTKRRSRHRNDVSASVPSAVSRSSVTRRRREQDGSGHRRGRQRVCVRVAVGSEKPGPMPQAADAGCAEANVRMTSITPIPMSVGMRRLKVNVLLARPRVHNR
jgi:hypothetical protein